MSRPPPAEPPGRRVQARRPDFPAEVTRVKLQGYLLALLLAAPGLSLLLLHLIQWRATSLILTHGAVMIGGIILTVLVWRDRQVLPRAEQVFAGLLFLSGLNFLAGYGQHPETVLTHDVLGTVLLFIVAGLMLVVPPRWSLPLSFALLALYWLVIRLYSGLPDQAIDLMLWMTLGMFALLTVGVLMRQMLGQILERAHLLTYTATHDPLTGLLNRRGFEDLAQAERLLLVLDADHFKAINDAHGHAVGDDVLRQLARRVEAHLPPGSLLARWGGEEFILLCPGDLPAGRTLAERIRTQVAAQPLATLTVTVCVGVTFWTADEAFRDAFTRADRAMYLAKQGGRNRVHVHEPTAPLPAAPPDPETKTAPPT